MPMTRPRQYFNRQGRIIFVSDGISGSRAWFTCFRKSSGSLKRVVTPALPERWNRDDAQADLDAFAQTHRLDEAPSGKE